MARNFSDNTALQRLINLSKKLHKILQERNQKTMDLIRHKKKIERIDSAQRRAESRTKIQLGGLIIKSGLTEFLNINAGDNLQLDPAALEKATTLLGGLLEAAERIKMDTDNDGSLLSEWKNRGDKSMRMKFLNIKQQATTLN